MNLHMERPRSMRLKDKLIRKNCPSCGEEIALGTSALNKKINCPKCRQTVVIPNGDHAPQEKPSPQKTLAKENGNGRRPATVKEPPVVLEEPLRSIQRSYTLEEIPGSDAGTEDGQVSEKRGVVYCLCNGKLTQRKDGNACSSAPADCCIHSNQPAS